MCSVVNCSHGVAKATGIKTDNKVLSLANLGRILLVSSIFGGLSSVFGRLQNPVLLILSSKNGRFRRPSKPSAS